MTNYCNFLSETLDDVIQNGVLDIPKLMTSIMDQNDCKEGYFFEVEQVDDFICRFSSSDKYVVGTKYILHDIPLETFNVFVRDAIVAVLAFDQQPTALLEELHNCIAISLHFSKMQNSDRDFILKTTTKILDYIKDMLQQIMSSPRITPSNQNEQTRLEKAIKDMSDSIDILRNVRDYALLTANRLQLKPTDINTRASINELLNRVGGIKYNILDSVPEMINIDNRRFQLDILLPIFLSLRDVAPFVRAVFSVESTSFARGNLELNIYVEGAQGVVDLPKHLQQVVRSRYVIPEYLRLCMAKELCRVTDGFTRLYSPNHVLFSIGFNFTLADNVWYGKRAILFISNRKLRESIYTMLSNMGANVTLFNDDNAFLYLNTLGSYQVALLESNSDDYIRRYLRRIRDRGLDIIGVGPPTVHTGDFSYIINGNSERELLDTYKKILAEKN